MSKIAAASLSALVVVAFVKPFIIMPAFVAMRTYVDPLYANQFCAMRLVNESDPRAYAAHPYWAGLEYGDECEGDMLQKYRSLQFDKFEAKVQVFQTQTINAVSAAVLAYQLPQLNWRSPLTTLAGTVLTFVVAFMGATSMLSHTHFNQDITYLTGAIIHHAEESSPGMNLKEGANAQGYLLAGVMNRLFYSFVMYALIKSSKRLRRVFNPAMVVAFVNLGIWFALYTVKTKHPIMHEVATPEMKASWPYTFEWRTYKHVIVHHDTGESFSGDFFMDPPFDQQLYAFGFFHNQVFGLELGTLGHHLFTAIFDIVTGLICIVFLAAVLHVGATAGEAIGYSGVPAGKAAPVEGVEGVKPKMK